MSARARYAVLGTALVLALAATATADSGEPVELRGSPLGDRTDLRLLVADARPFVLDVDSGSITRLSVGGEGVSTYVVGLSGRAAVVVGYPAYPQPPSGPNNRLYAVRGARAAVSPLGTGRDIASDATGSGVWVTRVERKSQCRLRHVGLDGQGSAPLAISCRWIIAPAGSLGLVVGRTRVVDPRTGRKLLGAPTGVLAVAGKRLLLAGGPGYAPGYRFTLWDAATGARHRFAWPSILGFTDTPLVEPSGRYIALQFADPSFNQTGNQVLDIWVLDTVTAKLTHVPGLPAYVSLKRTEAAWTHDGRLVVLGERDDRAFVAVWRPGQRTLRLKAVGLPRREGGSDSFAPLH